MYRDIDLQRPRFEVLRLGGGLSKSSKLKVRAAEEDAYAPLACGLVRLRIDGLRIPRRPKRDRGAPPGPGLGVMVTPADVAEADAASCSLTDVLLKLDTANRAKHWALRNSLCFGTRHGVATMSPNACIILVVQSKNRFRI